jgi:hypothetical protein
LTNLKNAFILLITVLLIPVFAVTAGAEESAETAYISIEVIDAQSGSILDSDGEYAFWKGIVAIEDLPPEEKALVVLPGNSQTRKNVPNYFQTNYADVRYGSGTIATSGCSITCLAMVAAYMTDHLYSPVELADYFGGSAYSNMARLETASDALQLPYAKASNWHESLQALKDGAFYASTGPEISNFYVEDGKAIIDCSPAAMIRLQSDKHPSVIEVSEDGSLTHAEFSLKHWAGPYGYIRLSVVDKNHKKAWTNPIFLK